MIIPHNELNEDTLTNMIEAFVNREGTDYGEHEYTLSEKTRQVREQLEAGYAVILYDDETEDFTIVFKDQLSDFNGGES